METRGSSGEETKGGFVSRVTQLDAVELDSELLNLVKLQCIKAFKYFKPGTGRNLEPEVDAFLRFIIWKFSVQSTHSTVGQKLLGLKYGGPPRQWKTAIYALCIIGLHWLQERSHDLCSLIRKPALAMKVSNIVSYIEIGLQVCSILNLLVFLQQGKYPTLLDRLLRLQPVSVMSEERSIGYTYMARELLWHGFAELLMSAVPLIKFHRLKSMVCSLFPWKKEPDSSSAPTFTLAVRCGVCREYPVLPHSLGCSHIFCFYCAQASYLASLRFACPLCGHMVEDIGGIIPVKM